MLPAAALLEFLVEVVPGLLTCRVWGLVRAVYSGYRLREEVLLDQGGIRHALWTVVVGGLGGHGGGCQLVLLEEVGKVAAVEHELEGAVDLGLVDGLEDTVEGLGMARSARCRWCGVARVWEEAGLCA